MTTLWTSSKYEQVRPILPHIYTRFGYFISIKINLKLPFSINFVLQLAFLFNKISSSSCRAISTDIPNPLSPPLPIIHGIRQVHRATSRIYTELLSVNSGWLPCLCSSQYPACLIRLILIVFMMGGRWPYSCCFMGCCLQDLFNIIRSILV